MDGKTQAAAAAASSMSLRTAREWDTGPVPSATKQPRDWRTRPDPFSEVWVEVEQKLGISPYAGAKALFMELQQQYPGKFPIGQLRTFQRRVKLWRLQYGPDKEVLFPQDWEARAKRFGMGLTVLRSDQCPYLEDATNGLLEAATEKGVKSRVIEIKTAAEAQNLSPSPYGVFNVVLDGRFLAYRYLLKEEFFQMLERK